MPPRPSYYRYWAKSPDGPGDSAHLVPYHNLDVAACAFVLLETDSALVNRIAHLLGFDATVVTQLVPMLLSLHDVGKFADSFQLLNRSLVEVLSGPSLRAARGPEYAPNYHGSLGVRAWNDALYPRLAPLVTGAPARPRGAAREALFPLVDAVMGHHGRPVAQAPLTDGVAPLFSAEALDDATRFAEDVARLFDHVSVPYAPDLLTRARRASWLVAGLAVLADWLGSDGHRFPRTTDVIPLRLYWERALRQARTAVKEAGVVPPPPSPGPSTVTHLFGFDTPTPLQSAVAALSPGTEPTLYVAEDLTGSGKTEAAVVLAHLVMRGGGASALYAGLPTMATADQMFERLANAAPRLFSGRPSVVLAHSARDLSERFADVRLAGQRPAATNPRADAAHSAEAQCATWIADRTKKALLAALGVGTVDQALLAALPVSHQSLRLLGLARSVLIVDEVHAYDPYMLTLLAHLLHFQAQLGGSAILLSATLPHATRQELADAFRRGLGQAPAPLLARSNEDYPLLTTVSREGPIETRVEADPALRRTLHVEHLSSDAAVIRRLVEEARLGRCAIWVRNTVDDAVNGYRLVQDAARAHPDIRPLLLHARYALGHRLEHQVVALAAFARDSGPRQRAGRILVASPVVEQSLDLDADLLVSDVAPVDLLLQRAGRLRRHARSTDGERLAERSAADQRGPAVFVLHAPAATAEPDALWVSGSMPGTASVYPDHGRLWLSLQALPHGATVRLPEQARALIESVYGDGVADRIPAGLRHATQRAEDEALGMKGEGGFASLNPEDGYAPSSQPWQREEAARTRLGPPTATLRLAAPTPAGPLAPLVAHRDGRWDLSEVRVRTSLVAQSPASPAGVAARRLMPDGGEHVVVVELRPAGTEVWTGTGMAASGRRRRITYSHATGLAAV